MDDFAIKVENVSKTFKLPREKQSSVKSMFINVLRTKKGYELQKALDDVSFEVKKGEFFGIVGRNGSGKSTLLKLIAEIYAPSAGSIHVNGKLTPFIELGVGFNPELTGRENVYLNGALLGFNRKDMNSMYDEIVEFAELERFMDQKLKNYSSGMQVRLAFSIAIRVKSDILLIDEVLAVGDAAFQEKCFDYFDKLKSRNMTIILVTHDMTAITRFCDRSMMVNRGKVIAIGSPQEVAAKYLQINDLQSAKDIDKKNDKNKSKYKTKVTLNKKGDYANGENAKLSIELPKTSKKAKHIGVAIYKTSGEYIFGTNTSLDKVNIKGNKIFYQVKLDIGPGRYYFKIGVFGEDTSKIIEFIDEGPSFNLRGRELNWEGLTFLPHDWESRE